MARRSRRNQSLANRAYFAGKGLPKASRRANGTGKTRKMYAYVRADQVGTPMETHIKSNYAEHDKQGNDYLAAHGQFANKGGMHFSEASGGLHSSWKRLYNTKRAGVMRNLITKQKMKTGPASRKTKDVFLVSFGADPKSR